MKKYDTIIIGGGHNALVAACYLKQKNILLLESRPVTGGAAQTEELYPGFKFSRFSYLLSLMRPSIIQELNLYQHGLTLFRRPISSITVTRNKGEYLLMNSDSAFCKSEIAKFSKKDSEVYDEYNRFLSDIIDLWSYY
jgi:phytoene dehydrogenase-like protein